MQVTLNKANKLVNKLNTYITQNFPKQYTGVNIENTFDILYSGTIADADTFMTETRNSQSEKKEKLDQYLCLLEDYHRLKEQLFRENITSGLSEVLYKITVCNAKISTLERLLQRVESNYTSLFVNDDLVEKINGGVYDQYSKRISINVFEKEDLASKLAAAKAELNLLEDKKESFNSHKKINVELSQYSKSVLGL